MSFEEMLISQLGFFSFREKKPHPVPKYYNRLHWILLYKQPLIFRNRVIYKYQVYNYGLRTRSTSRRELLYIYIEVYQVSITPEVKGRYWSDRGCLYITVVLKYMLCFCLTNASSTCARLRWLTSLPHSGPEYKGRLDIITHTKRSLYFHLEW